MSRPPNQDPKEFMLALLEAVLSVAVIVACLLYVGWLAAMLWTCLMRGCISQ